MLGGAPTTKGATRGEAYLATQARACAVSKPALWTACERPRRRRVGAWAAAAGAPRRRRVGASAAAAGAQERVGGTAAGGASPAGSGWFSTDSQKVGPAQAGGGTAAASSSIVARPHS